MGRGSVCVSSAAARTQIFFLAAAIEHQHASFYAITVEKLPEGMVKPSHSYFKRRVLGDTVFAALYDTFHAFRHAKRALGAWHEKYTKIFKALTSGDEYDALRMKLLTAGGQVPHDTDLRRHKEFETLGCSAACCWNTTKT